MVELFFTKTAYLLNLAFKIEKLKQNINFLLSANPKIPNFNVIDFIYNSFLLLKII